MQRSGKVQSFNSRLQLRNYHIYLFHEKKSISQSFSYVIANEGSLADYAKKANPNNNKEIAQPHVAAASGQLVIFEYIFRKAKELHGFMLLQQVVNR